MKALLEREITGIAGIAAQNSVGTSTVLWRGFASMSASWLPTSFLMRLSFSRSSLHATDITMCPDRSQPLAVRLVQVLFNPFAVDLVGTAVTGKRVHVPRGLLELAQALRRIVDEEVLVHDMVACEQDAYRRGRRRRQSLRSVDNRS